MKRAERNPVKSRQEIIEKTAPVFNIHGFAGASMQMIIDATGYQKGGIYRHFESKKQLAQAVFRYNFSQLKQSYLDGVTEVSTARERLLKLLTNFLQTVANPAVKGGCPMLNMATEVDDTDADMRLMVSEALSELSHTIEDIMEQGIGNGEFKSEVIPKKEANFIMALLEGSIMMAKVQGKRRIILGNCEQLLHYLNHFVFKQPYILKTQSL